MILDAKNLQADALQKAANAILCGGIVAIPTETVYGLAANAFNEEAVRKIFIAKGRPFIDPLICHVPDFEALETIAVPNESALKLAEAFSPGPITYVLPKKENIPSIVSAGNPTVAVRIPAHPLMRAFLNLVKVPLSAPSANPFGYVSPTKAEHVEAQLGNKVDFILDGGQCECGVESTIVMLTDENAPMLLRPGPISREQIEKVLGKSVRYPKDKNPAHPEAPGMMKSHYSPNAMLRLFEGQTCEANAENALLYFKRPQAPKAHEYWLSEDGNISEAAKNLFDLIRTLDTKYKFIHCEKLPNEGVGEAVNDRLKRAANK